MRNALRQRLVDEEIAKIPAPVLFPLHSTLDFFNAKNKIENENIRMSIKIVVESHDKSLKSEIKVDNVEFNI